jgi:hypothetical protein
MGEHQVGYDQGIAARRSGAGRADLEGNDGILLFDQERTRRRRSAARTSGKLRPPTGSAGDSDHIGVLARPCSPDRGDASIGKDHRPPAGLGSRSRDCCDETR